MVSRSAKTDPESGVAPSRTGDDDRVLVGQIVRAHGLRGEVKVDVYSDIAERFDAGSTLLLVTSSKGTLARRGPQTIRVLSSRPVKGGVLAMLDGVTDRDQAEALRGARLEVETTDVPEAPEGLYYYFQLMGCRCTDHELGDLGEVVEVIEDGGGILLEIAYSGQKLLLPFVDAFLAEVDVESKRIVWNLPPGIVETCVSKS